MKHKAISDELIVFSNLIFRFMKIDIFPQSVKLTKVFDIRLQEKNLNMSGDSKLGPPDLYPDALPIEISWFFSWNLIV